MVRYVLSYHQNTEYFSGEKSVRHKMEAHLRPAERVIFTVKAGYIFAEQMPCAKREKTGKAAFALRASPRQKTKNV